MYFRKDIIIEEKKYKVWITLLGIKYKTYEILINSLGSLNKIYHASKEQLKEIKNLKESTIEKILNNKIKNDIERHLNFMKKNKIDIIYINDKEYPQRLKEIYDPPICLYIKGNKNILINNGIAIIGCRDYSEYGKENALKFSYEIAKNKVNIISGLAKGIDSFAHIGALKANEKTIAVVGTGLDIVYPKENIKLANEIINKEGAIITEYPLGTKPNRWNFPARNRIISGLSNGVLVIEAKEKSGTLITVDFALEQGRNIYCIPGNINSANSYGTNELIKQGAEIVTKSNEIIINFDTNI